ncbi:MAG TPA: feruloyl-CoA synthetase [Gammaproteobacteria bacterium]|nr:feruloyl-CoA synthetase [Gammaproteobacteria bacterium]
MYEVDLTLSEFSAQDDDEVLNTTVGEVLRAAAADSADITALIECKEDGQIGRRLTYSELLAQSEALAGRLAAAFLPGERIAVWAPNIPEWVILEYAAAFAGLTLVTVNPAYRPAELEYVLKQSRTVGLFLVPGFRGNPMRKIADEVVADIPAVRAVYEMQDLDAMSSLMATEYPETVGLPEVDVMDPVQIQYTSGTTGFPKGAVLHHRGITNNGRLTLGRVGLARGQLYLNPMPMFHCSGCVVATLGSAQLRATMVIAAMFEPGSMLDVISGEQVYAMLSVPTMLVSLIEAQQQTPRDLKSLAVVISGGSMVPPELVRQVQSVMGAKTSIVYGQTETSPVVTQTTLADAFDDATETVGQPLPCTEMSIRSPEDNSVMPVDEIGEICSRGYCNMLGYNDNPEATAETIDSNGWLHTGDLGSMDSRGFVKVTGRVKEMIIRGGENLFPAEIENRLLEHPQILEVAVVGIPDHKWGEVVAVFLRISGEPMGMEDLVTFCRQTLSPQKTPKYWIFVDEWPLTGSGKIQKFVLREQFEEGKFEVMSR